MPRLSRHDVSLIIRLLRSHAEASLSNESEAGQLLRRLEQRMSQSDHDAQCRKAWRRGLLKADGGRR